MSCCGSDGGGSRSENDQCSDELPAVAIDGDHCREADHQGEPARATGCEVQGSDERGDRCGCNHADRRTRRANRKGNRKNRPEPAEDAQGVGISDHNPLWYLDEKHSGEFWIRDSGDGGKCLDVEGARAEDASLTAWPCDPKDDHLWAFKPAN